MTKELAGVQDEVIQFVDRYYKPDRLNREVGTRGRIIASGIEDVLKYGATLISRHDSVTGKTEWLRRGE